MRPGWVVAIALCSFGCGKGADAEQPMASVSEPRDDRGTSAPATGVSSTNPVQPAMGRPDLFGPGCYGDGDGLSKELELDAGLDPCKNDSDGDGCLDAFEYYLGGCSDPGNAALFVPCYSAGSATVDVSYVLPSSGGPFARVELVLPGTDQTSFLASALSSTPPAGVSPEGDAFVNVPNGARVTFRIRIGDTDGSTFRGSFYLVADGRRISRHRIVMVFETLCPIEN
jgi:hypothetical protein